MTFSAQIAKHFRELYFGGNWTSSNLKDTLSDLTWEETIVKIGDLNTIATLSYHVSYYVSAVLKVLQGDTLNAKDEYSFKHPPVNAQEDWDNFLERIWREAIEFASLIELLPDSRLMEILEDEKYGIYYRNLHGIIEHTHYHLGQIVILKKIIRNSAK